MLFLDWSKMYSGRFKNIYANDPIGLTPSKKRGEWPKRKQNSGCLGHSGCRAKAPGVTHICVVCHGLPSPGQATLPFGHSGCPNIQTRAHICRTLDHPHATFGCSGCGSVSPTAFGPPPCILLRSKFNTGCSGSRQSFHLWFSRYATSKKLSRKPTTPPRFEI